jgi:glycosyltransferase involved in cell wall biosynthesis
MPEAEAVAEAPRLVLDLTDLLTYFEQNRAPMGIARVQMALVEAALAAGAARPFQAVSLDLATEALREAPDAALSALVSAARAGGSKEDPAWIAAREGFLRALEEAPAFPFRRDDRLLTLGAGWWVPGHLRRLRALQRDIGVRLVCFVHDVIPLVVPEHCDPGLVQSFKGHFVALCAHADLVLANSHVSAHDFLRFQRQLLPAMTLPLRVVHWDAPLPPPQGPVPPLRLRPYVLCVATIESRKNHLLLLHAWLTLIRRHGEHAVPDLVLVGRRGHGHEPVIRLLEGAPELRRKVEVRENIGDAELAGLYAGAMFCVFNSFYEGWGLPVTEALSYGKAVLVPDLPVLREAGGEEAVYFTPQSEPALVEAAWRLIAPPAAEPPSEPEPPPARGWLGAAGAWRRRPETAAIPPADSAPRHRPLRSWLGVAEVLRDAALGEAPLPPDPALRVPFPLNRRVGLDALYAAQPGLRGALPNLVRDGEGWSILEDWGSWALAGPCRLRIHLARAVAEDMLLHIEAQAPGGVEMRVPVRVHPPGGEARPWRRLFLPAGGAVRIFRLPVPPCGPGDVVVEIDTGEGLSFPGDTRRLSVGIRGVMLCRRRDASARLAYARGLLNMAWTERVD